MLAGHFVSFSCPMHGAISVIGDWELLLTVGLSGAYWKT
jgi:hypothetical protein